MAKYLAALAQCISVDVLCHLATLVLSIVIIISPAFGSNRSFPIGIAQRCFNEGEKIEPSFLQSDPCITCKCTEGLVVCTKEQCANRECHVVLAGEVIANSSCCEQCKTCHYKGRFYAHGEDIVDPQAPCKVALCRSGIITEIQLQCQVPCANPLPPSPGECCPKCPSASCSEKKSETASSPANSPRNHGEQRVPITALSSYGHTATSDHSTSGYFTSGGFTSGLSASGSTSPMIAKLVDSRVKVSRSFDDPCNQCQCDNTTGHVTCSRVTCPVLACSLAESTRVPGRCCPQCLGIHRVAPQDTNHCRVAGLTVVDQTEFHLDDCTICRCDGSTTVCRRHPCPPPDCPPHLQMARNGTCCAVCRQPQRVRRNCRQKRRVIEDGATWRLSECTRCQCSDGRIQCEKHPCPSLQCPYGYRAVKKPGECCQQCVEDDAVCTVFGDPHYNTFDGRLYNYQGTCRYMLAKDCVGHSFSVRVANDPKNSQFFSWTKTAFIKAGTVKITLKQNFKVKIDGEEVALPYVDLNKVTVYRNPKDNFNIAVRLYNIGVTVIWDGDSFLQVKIPSIYKGRMCGLCGNYNGDKSDDLADKRNIPVKSVAKFARSWRLGGKRFCSRKPLHRRRWRKKKKTRKKKGRNFLVRKQMRSRASSKCQVLRSPIFSQCLSAVSPTPYYTSCMQDMVECEAHGMCYCEAVTAYAHECSRHSLAPIDWANSTLCGADRRCGTGGRFVQCVDHCQPTCASPNGESAACLSQKHDPDALCTPGCVCRTGMMRHKNKCIPSILCPA